MKVAEMSEDLSFPKVKWLDVGELAEILGVPKSRIYYWTSLNEIPRYKIGQTLRFRLDEILNWMETKRCK